MPAITEDVVATGSAVAGPTTDSLTVPWALNVGAQAGLVIAAFKYNTTAPSSRSITRTVTHNGKAMHQIVERGMGWGLPSKGFVEMWALAAPDIDTGSHQTSVGLAYAQDTADPWSPEHSTFSNFSGVSLSLDGATGWKEPVGYIGTTEHSAHGSGKMMSLGISAFQNSITVAVLGCDGAIDAEALEDNVIFTDAGKNLVVALVRGSGALKVQGEGGNWAAISANILPV